MERSIRHDILFIDNASIYPDFAIV